ncbi:hypothetical protein BDN67DRAFT_1014534 [Paxillus ammoniavirescens]|nr:hypothetical protein BDN67DRAFT_1014534 [Paxillus ammoniavirescens]
MAPDKEPWRPYRVSGDFEFAEIALEAGLNAAQIDGLLSLIFHVSQGQAEVTLKNEADLHKAWDHAAMELTPISDYEELCMMSLIRGTRGKCPCPVYFVPLDELCDLHKTFPQRTVQQAKDGLDAYWIKKLVGEVILKNVFWLVAHSNPEWAISFDHLHTLHLGIWKHIFEDLKLILQVLGRNFEAKLEEQVVDFPRWRGLVHFDTVIHITYSDGNKMHDLSWQIFYAALNILTRTGSPPHSDELKDYIKLVGQGENDKLKLDWDFPKAHLWKHVGHDIRNKGAARNYSTCPNEKMHGPLKAAYQDRSNGKDVAGQILRVDHHQLTHKLLRGRIDAECELALANQAGDEGSQDNNNDNGGPGQFQGHIKLGVPHKPQSIQDIETAHQMDRVFDGFRWKFTAWVNETLPTYNYQLTRWITFPATHQLQEHGYLKVNYESKVDWKKATDHLQCNLFFHGHVRYDCALVQLAADQTAFVQLIFMFSYEIPDLGNFQLALVQPYTAGIGIQCRLDRDFKLTRVKAVPRPVSIFIPLESIIRGDEFLVVDHIDSDMFLHMRNWSRGQN